ncbi:MAG: hypothetical protein AB1414_11435 [bacterium]
MFLTERLFSLKILWSGVVLLKDRYYVPNGTMILMPYLWVLSYVNFQLITAIGWHKAVLILTLASLSIPYFYPPT